MLNVDGGQDTDAGVEQLEHVLISLLVPSARRVRVRQLVDDGELRFPREDGLEIHLFEDHAPVLDAAPRDDRQILQPRFGVGAAVRLDEADHDIDALPTEGMGVFDHRIGLADTGGSADVDAEARALRRLQLRQRLLARDASGIRHQGIVARAQRRSAAALYELFTTF